MPESNTEKAHIDVPFVLTREDFLTGGEADELDRLRHAAKFYGGNMQQRSLDRLNWLEVAYQRDVLWGAYRAQADRLARVAESVDSLADSIHGDSGWEHSGGCEGEPDCFACIVLDLRRIASEIGTPPGQGADA